MNSILVSATLGTFIFLTWYILSKKRPSDLPPGPWNLPILGSLHWLSAQEPHLSLTALSKKFGPIFSLKLGRINTVVISDARLLKKVLRTDESLGRAPLYLPNMLTKGKGILFTEGIMWRQRRKFVTNFLREVGVSKISSNRTSLETRIMKNVENFIQYVKSRGNRIVFNPWESVQYSVASVAADLFLGKCWDRDDLFFRRLLHLVNEATKLTEFAGVLNFLPFVRLFPPYRKVSMFLDEVVNTIHLTYYRIIKETRTQLQSEKYSFYNLIEAFFDQTLGSDLDKISTEEELSYLLIDMFAAAVETTTNSILWIFLYLAEYTKVQTKLRQELCGVLQGEVPTMNDLENLHFMQATIAEVARIRTIVPLGVPQCSLGDIQIDEFRIPKGVMIMPLLWGIHMDPKVWKDPENFKPERFLDESGKFYKPESYIPFQTGKRMCVGEDLSRMIVFLLIASTLQNFHITSNVECEIDLHGVCGPTLTPKPQKLLFLKI